MKPKGTMYVSCGVMGVCASAIEGSVPYFERKKFKKMWKRNYNDSKFKWISKTYLLKNNYDFEQIVENVTWL